MRIYCKHGLPRHACPGQPYARIQHPTCWTLASDGRSPAFRQKQIPVLQRREWGIAEVGEPAICPTLAEASRRLPRERGTPTAPRDWHPFRTTGQLFVVQASACSSAGKNRGGSDTRDRSRWVEALCPRAHARGYDMSSPVGALRGLATRSAACLMSFSQKQIPVLQRREWGIAEAGEPAICPALAEASRRLPRKRGTPTAPRDRHPFRTTGHTLRVSTTKRMDSPA
jgi:hypothetical protein